MTTPLSVLVLVALQERVRVTSRRQTLAAQVSVGSHAVTVAPRTAHELIAIAAITLLALKLMECRARQDLGTRILAVNIIRHLSGHSELSNAVARGTEPAVHTLNARCFAFTRHNARR